MVPEKIMSQWWLRALWRLNDNIHMKFLPSLVFGILSVLSKYDFPICWWLSILLRQKKPNTLEHAAPKQNCAAGEVGASPCLHISSPSLVLHRTCRPSWGHSLSPDWGHPLLVSPAPCVSQFVAVTLHSFPPLEAALFFFPFKNFVVCLYFSEYCYSWPHCFLYLWGKHQVTHHNECFLSYQPAGFKPRRHYHPNQPLEPLASYCTSLVLISAICKMGMETVR